MHLESTERKYTGNNICSIENEENGLDQVIDVYFDAFQKRYYFLNNPKFSVEINDQVIVETQMGLAIGKVISLKKAAIKSNGEALKMIIRVATKKDIEKNNELKAEAIKAGYIFKNKLRKYNLNLKLVSTEYTFDKKKLIFYFASEDRVDFRELVKELASIFRVRIELRQISVRDQLSQMEGCCGICGRELCCQKFINDFDTVSVKMIKEQNLSLNTSKMTGNCGKLMCCLRYEQNVYEDKANKLPKPGAKVFCKTEGSGVVDSVEYLKELVRVKFVDNENNYYYKKIKASDLEY